MLDALPPALSARLTTSDRVDSVRLYILRALSMPDSLGEDALLLAIANSALAGKKEAHYPGQHAQVPPPLHTRTLPCPP